MLRALMVLMLISLGSLPARADTDAIPVDVELVLAVDVSRSMTPRELEIQRKGYAQALTHSEVIDAILYTGYGRIALTYVEWAGNTAHRTIIDWTLIRSAEDAEAVAKRLTASFDASLRRTSISGIIDHASGLFEDNGYRGLRRVIDISGDGPNNQGRPVLAARDAAVASGIIINGLPLMTREGMGSQWHLDDLDLYYRDCVIGGPASFVIPVHDWNNFAAAVRRKLVLELAGRMPVHRAAWSGQGLKGYDCLIGEKIWDEIMQGWE